MARFFTVLAKNYDPHNVDMGLFAMHVDAPHCVPLVATSEVDPESGTISVDGIPVSKGKSVKFDFSPLPMFFIPVGEVAREFGKTYTVKLTGFRNRKGHKFAPCTFRLTTAAELFDDGAHAENDAVAKQVSDEGIVLLANDETLPLAKGSKIALFGDYRDFRVSAIGASLIKPRRQPSLEQAIKESGALSVRQDADTALFVLSRGSSENRDNKPIQGGYFLTDDEKIKLSASTEKFKKVILVLNTAYPVEMEFFSSLPLAAILWTGLCGQSGAESLVDILSGKVCPSARLADTWAYNYYDIAAAHNFINQDKDFPVFSDDGKKRGVHVYYEERQFVGYRYFDSFGKRAAYMFGHGLSYTDFSVEAKAEWNGKLTVIAKVKNTGESEGKFSMPIYVEIPKGENSPRKAFVGFEKTKALAPGESEVLTITAPAKDFSVYDASKSAFVLRKGEYVVYGGDAIDTAEKIGGFFVKEEIVVERTISVLKEVEQVGGIDKYGVVKERTAMVPAGKRIEIAANYVKPHYPQLKKNSGALITFADVKNDDSKLDAFVSQFSLRELVNFTVCNGSCWRPKENGAAGRLAHSDKFGVPTMYMSDGNCGVNLNRRTTGFPTSNVLAGTFNKQLAYAVGKAIAVESAEYGIAINLGPGGNLHRNPLCGRHPEYFSEDPILTGTLMAFQARGLEENGVLATYKHLLCNNMELERKSCHSIVDERTLRELYLRVFDKAFSLHKPSCVMTSYNPVNGIYPSECAPLLNDLLRDEWGFDGFSMTDWGSCDTADVIRSVNAGTNMLTPGDKKMFKKIYTAAKRGEIEIGTLQEGVKRVLKILLKRIKI